MRILLLCLSLLLTLTASAQDRRGSWYLSGSTMAEFSSISSELTGAVYTPSNPFERLDGSRATAYRSGYFLTNRLLVGSRVDFLDSKSIFYQGSTTALILKPFVRYYAFDGANSKTAYFGEVGFGTVGFGDADRFETDFHLGIGAERNIAAGIVATSNLNYDANASGLNYTNLTLGLNVLTGQLEKATAAAPVTAGTWSAAGQLGRLAYGRTQSGLDKQSEFQLDISPRIGYFLLDGLMLEATLNFTYSAYSSEFPAVTFRGGNSRLNDLDVSLQARYYVLQRGRLLPYASAGVGYLHSKQRYFGSPTDDSTYDLKTGIRSFPYKLAIGATYFLSPQLALDVAGDYNRGRAESTTDNFFLTASERQLRISTGLRFFLAGR